MRYLDSLQIFRAIAVLFVIIRHNVAAINYYHTSEFKFLNFLGDVGRYGVDFFFVLSGFIIAYTVKFKLEAPKGLNKYLKNRIIRIYVPYLPASIGLLILYNIFPNFSNSNREISTITSLTLLPDGRPALSVAWTLTFEIIFYIFYSLRFFGEKIFKIVLFFWFGLILFINAFFQDLVVLNNYPWLKVLGSLYNIEFFLGILLAYLFINNKKVKKELVILLSIVFFGCFLYVLASNFRYYYFLPNLLFSIFVGLIIYFTIFYKEMKLSSKNIFMIMGNASYSIYLVHNNMQSLLIRFFPEICIELRIFLMLVLTIIISCVLGYIYSNIFEVRVTKYVKKIIG